MLELNDVDLEDLAQALEDHSHLMEWYIDPTSGEVLLHTDGVDQQDPRTRDALPIEPVPCSVVYADLRDFVDQVSDRRAKDLLGRAIEGRGAFRRFKDTLLAFPELRQTWFAFHDARMRRRAIEWLADNGLIDEKEAESAIAELYELPVGEGVVDAFALARQVAQGLGELFGRRLVDVVVFGSHATGAATEESDLDLIVVLDDVRAPWDDERCMDELLWQHTLATGVTVSAFVVDTAEWRHPQSPLLRSARAQAQSVA